MNPNKQYQNLAMRPSVASEGPSLGVPPQDPSLGQQEMATPEEMADLQQFLLEIEKKLERINSIMQTTNQYDSQDRQKLLNLFLEKLSSLGIDLNDPKAVSDYLQYVKGQDPELEAMIEDILNHFMEDPMQPKKPVPKVDTNVPDNLYEANQPQSPSGPGIDPSQVVL